MTLFSWFRKSYTNDELHLQTKKPLTLDHQSMWPIAKVEMTSQLLDQNNHDTKGDSDLGDIFINPDL